MIRFLTGNTCRGLAPCALAGFLLLLALPAAGRGEEKTEVYASGKPHLVYNVDELGRKDGTYKELDPDGKVLLVANYVKGSLDGPYRSFYPGGKPKIVAAYAAGKLFGKYRRFVESGDVAITANFKAGKLHGERQEFSAGKVTKDEIWNDGELAKAAGLKAGKLHGPRREFADNRVLADEFWYEGQLLIPKGPQLITDQLTAIRKMPVPMTGDFPRVTVKLNETLRAPSFAAQQEPALRTLAAYRFLADLPYKDLEIDRGYAAHAQAGAELLTRLDKLTHTPENPGLPEDEYKFAYEGPSHSNISTAGDSAASVQMFMDDSDLGNIEQLGHRRWCLNPATLKTGFGADGKHTCMWAFDSSRKEIPDYDAVAFPPRGLTPTTHFKSGQAWSFTVNPKKYRPPEASLKVTVTPLRFDPVKVIVEKESKPLELDFFKVSREGYGVPNCVIFRPKDAKVAAGAAYMVNISGLKDSDGKDYPVEYFVGFFTPEK